MSNYERTTRECTIDQLRPELQQAFRNYFAARKLTELDEASLRCCETSSYKKQGGWLSNWLDAGEETTTYTALVLTPEALLWARSAEPARSEVRVIGASLFAIRVRTVTPLLTQDSGLEISGLIEGSKAFMRGYIGLGKDLAAEKFCEEVDLAIEKVNPRPTRKFPSWMGGNR